MHGFHIWEFIHLLKLIVIPKSVLMALWWSFVDMHRTTGNLSCPLSSFMASWGQPWPALPSSSSSYRTVLLWSTYCSIFFAFLCYLLMILLFKMASKCSAEVQKIGMCLMEKIHVLDKHSGMSSRVAGQEFSVIESALYTVTLSRNTHKTRLCIDWLMKMTWGLEEPSHAFLLGGMV